MKLHLGCGKRDFGSDWIHIDGGNFPHVTHHDITKLPFESGSVDLIYASHVIEYFDLEEVIPLLDEWHRVLKPGGVLRVAVPDFFKIAELYLGMHYRLDSFIGMLYGKMKMGDKTIYHKMAYDFKQLKSVLEFCKFTNVKKYDWRETDHAQFDDHSQAYLPHMNKETGVLMSLNVECTK